MDQEAFRKLLETPHPGATQSKQFGRGSLLPTKDKKQQQQGADAPKAEFKPRKVKKKDDSSYRDRAAERRLGVAGDFAEVEAVLESFEKQHADIDDRQTVEERRRYLGGDSEHTVLVKGLDFALLEQTKARVDASAEDDDMLEDVFRGANDSGPASPPAVNSRKRTREDLVRELKQKRVKGENSEGHEECKIVEKGIEEIKKEGKFKPIGFRPVGSSASKVKEGKDKNGSKKKKKKLKATDSKIARSEELVTGKGVPSSTGGKDGPAPPRPPLDPQKSETNPPGPDPEPMDEDFDIFADAGEYEGLELDDDDSDGNERVKDEKTHRTTEKPKESQTPETLPRRRWFDDEEPPSPPPERALSSNSKGKEKEAAGSESPGEPEEGEVGLENMQERPTRLAPLASSAVPSIRDILAADEALEADKKRRARKEKRKAGGDGDGEGKKKVSAEAKLNRDYQKLKTYTEKKDGANKKGGSSAT